MKKNTTYIASACFVLVFLSMTVNAYDLGDVSLGDITLVGPEETIPDVPEVEITLPEVEITLSEDGNVLFNTLEAWQALLLDSEEALDTEKESLLVVINGLSDEQIDNLNSALNNATNNGLVLDLNSSYLQQVSGGDYNQKQINFLTKALEEEAKFRRISETFLAKFEKNGNEVFLAHAEKMAEKGQARKEMFLSKI